MIKILIVDDSETVRTTLGKDLIEAGYLVIEARDGLQALDLIPRNKNIKLILTDVNMPNMDGLTMCEEIKKRGVIKSVPVIALTTQTGQEFKDRGKAAGVVAWIVKPYAKNSLLMGVKKVIDKFSPPINQLLLSLKNIYQGR